MRGADDRLAGVHHGRQMPNGNDFGKAKQYGKFTVALGLPEDASPIMHNRNC